MMEKMKSPLFWLGVFGALKLALDTMGHGVITDAQVNALANGLATVFAIVGVYATHNKPAVTPEVTPVITAENTQG